MGRQEISALVKIRKGKAIGFNHVALLLGNFDDPPGLLRGLIDFELCRRSEEIAFVNPRDLFIALQ